MLMQLIRNCLISILIYGIACPVANSTEPLKRLGLVDKVLNPTSQEDCSIVKQGLRLCDKALNSAREVMVAQDEYSEKQMAIIDKQTAEIVDLKQSKESWFNSKTLWVGLGMLIGGATVYKLRK